MPVSASGLRTPVSRFVRTLTISLAVMILGLLAVAGSASAAIGVSDFSLTPSTTLQGANPDLSISATRSGTGSDLLKQATLALAPGISYSVAATTKCSSFNFDRDRCPATSVVGTTTGFGTLKLVGKNLVAGEAAGTVYALSSSQIGMIYRPSGLPRIAVKATIAGSPATGITLTSGNFPRTTTILGRQVNLVISGLAISLHARSGASGTGPVVVTNPSTCGAATSTLTFSAYNGTTGSQSSSYGVTGCGPLIDNVSPTVIITAPTAGQLLTGGIGTANATWVIADTAPAGVTPSGVNDAATTCSLTGSSGGESIPAAPCPGGAKTFTWLDQGSYMLTVVAMDNAGNQTTATRSFAVQIEAPPGPTVTIAAPTITGNTAALTWSITTSSSSGINDAATTCALTGPTPVASSACPGGAKTFSGLASGSYTLTVNAEDGARNTGSATRSFTIVPPEVEGPNVVITAPAEGAVISPNSVTATWTITSGQFEVVDSQTTCALAGPTPTATALCPGGMKTFTGLANGSYTLTVIARDVAGNVDVATRSFTQSFAHDGIGPTVTITAPTAGQVSTSNTVNAAWSIIDTAQPDAVVAGVNDAGTTCSLSGPTPSATTACPGRAKTFTGLANGGYTLTVTGMDNAGNTGTPTTRFFTVGGDDNIPPTVSISSPVSGQMFASTSVSATWSITDTAQSGVFPAGVDGSATTCSLSGPTPVATALCPGGSKTFTALLPGNYVLTINAWDNFGNMSSTTRAFSVGIE